MFPKDEPSPLTEVRAEPLFDIIISVENAIKNHIYSIEEISQMVAPIAADFGVRKLSVFGSYARGEVTAESDLDFRIIDKGTLRGLFRLAGFELALEERFKMPVDVVTANSLFRDVLERVEREERVVYEA